VGQRARTFVADSFAVFATRIAVMCATVATGVILARCLGPEGRGAFAALLVVPGFVVAVAELGIRQATVYEVGKAEYSQESIVQTLLFLLLASSVLGASIVAGYFFVIPQTSFTATVIALVCLMVPLQLVSKYLSGFMLGRNEIQAFNRVSWIPAIASLSLTVLLVVVLLQGVFGAVLSVVIAHAVVALYAIKLVKERVKLGIRLHRPLAVRMLKLGFVYAASLFVIGLNYRVDILFLERITGLEAVGYYSVAVSLAELIWQIPAATGVVVFARSSRATDRAEFSKKVAALFRLSFLLSAIASLIIAWAAPMVIVLVFGAEFRPGADALRLLLPGIVLMVAHKVLNMDLAGRGKPHIALYSFVPAVVVNVILNALWIPTMGISGAALASTVSYGVSAVLLVVMYSTTTGLTIAQILRPSGLDRELVRQLLRKVRSRA